MPPISEYIGSKKEIVIFTIEDQAKSMPHLCQFSRNILKWGDGAIVYERSV